MVIRKRWVGLEGSDKTEVRTSLHLYLTNRHASLPIFIRNKAAKLLVDIAGTDWPHFYPTFFNDVFNWILGGSQTVLVGLSTLLIASEELATPRDTISSSRKDELRRLLVTQVPQVLTDPFNPS